MALTTHLDGYVGFEIQARGYSYYRRGAVKVIHGNEEELSALIAGTETYEIDLYREEDTVHASCTCPYFDGQREICKHIWAALLAAEKLGYLRGGDNSDPARLEIDVDNDEWGEDEEWEDEDFVRPGYPRTVLLAAAPEKRPSSSGSPAAGMERSSGLPARGLADSAGTSIPGFLKGSGGLLPTVAKKELYLTRGHPRQVALDFVHVSSLTQRVRTAGSKETIQENSRGLRGSITFKLQNTSVYMSHFVEGVMSSGLKTISWISVFTSAAPCRCVVK